MVPTAGTQEGVHGVHRKAGSYHSASSALAGLFSMHAGSCFSGVELTLPRPLDGPPTYLIHSIRSAPCLLDQVAYAGHALTCHMPVLSEKGFQSNNGQSVDPSALFRTSISSRWL